jgi:hypothetical protein
LKFATDVGTPVKGLVAKLEELHAGAAGLDISITPKKLEPEPLNPGCVTNILVLTTVNVGGDHGPEVAGEVGVLPEVTPLIVINAPPDRSYAKGSSFPGFLAVDTIPYATVPMTMKPETKVGDVNPLKVVIGFPTPGLATTISGLP